MHRPGESGSRADTDLNGLFADDELADGPVFVAAVWKVSPDDQGDLFGCQLLHGNLQWVGLALSRHEDRCVHPAESNVRIEAEGQRIESLFAIHRVLLLVISWAQGRELLTRSAGPGCPESWHARTWSCKGW